MLSIFSPLYKKWLSLTRGSVSSENTQFPKIDYSWLRILPSPAPSPCSLHLANPSSLGLPPNYGLGFLLSVPVRLHSHSHLNMFF